MAAQAMAEIDQVPVTITPNSILDVIRNQPEYTRLVDSLSAGTSRLVWDCRAARLLRPAALHQDLGRTVVLITDRADHALSLTTNSIWLKPPRYLFAEPNPLFLEQAVGRGHTSNGCRPLSTDGPSAPLRQKGSPACDRQLGALVDDALVPAGIHPSCKRLAAGASVQLDCLVREWARIGYPRVNTVLEPGQFSHRGGLLDVWPPSDPGPSRLDFFGDEIESIRRFDPATQRTLEKIEVVLVTPAREFLLNGDHRVMESAESDSLTEFHIPILHPAPASLLDYLPDNALVLIDDLSLIETMVGEVEEQAVKFRAESIAEGTLAPDFPVPYLTWSELNDSLHGRVVLELGRSSEPTAGETDGIGLSGRFGHDERFGGRLKPFNEYLLDLVRKDRQILVVSRQAQLQELWAENKLDRRPRTGLSGPLLGGVCPSE
jgi:transcription-repair coupling factor (superfamily II helicase)